MSERLDRLPVLVFRRHRAPPFAFAEASAASREITGLPAESLLADPGTFWRGLSDHDGDRLRSALQEAAASARAYSVAYPYHGADGRIRSLLEQGRPVTDTEGRVLGWDGIVVDLGESGRASQPEETLQEGNLDGNLDGASIERLRAIAENARDAVTEITPDARLLYVSPSFSEMFGYRPAEVLGKNALELIHPDDLVQVEEIRAQAMAEERPAQLTFRFRHADGSWPWVETTGRPYRTRSGELRAVLISRDVTDRVKAEAAVQEQLRLETRVAEVARTLLHLEPEQLDGGFERALEAAAELAGADRAEFQYVNRDGKTLGGHHLWCGPGVPDRPPTERRDTLRRYRWSVGRLMAGEVLHIPDPTQLPHEARHERERLVAGGVRAYLGIPIRHGDRSMGFLDFARLHTSSPWTDAEITRLQLVTELFSITLRRLQAEQDRAASEERFRAIAENVHDSICEFSLDGRLLYANAGFGKISGYTHAELAATNPIDLVHPEDRHRLRDRMRSWRTAEDVDEVLLYRVRARNGSWKWLESTARGYRTASNQERVAVVNRDVTDREMGQAELERRLELENRIAEISRSFVAIEAEAVGDAIQRGLEAAAAIAGAERAYLVSTSERKNASVQFYDWCAPGVPARAHKLGLADRSKQAWATERLLAGELVRVSCVADLPDEAQHVRESLMEAGVQSFLGIPVRIGGHMTGVLGFHCLAQEQHWSDHEIDLLRLVAELFTGAARRGEAEADLRESETRFRTLAEHARDPIVEIDEQGKILYSSPSLTELFGFEPDELAGMDFASLIHLDDLAGIYRRCGPQLNTEGSGPIQYRARRRDGSWLHIEATARVFAGAGGDKRSVCVMRDVTERHRSQESLERQLEMETRIADLSQRFLGAAVDEIDAAIRESVRVLGAVAEADRTWLYHLDADAPDQGVFEWCGPEVDSHRDHVAMTRAQSFPWATRQLLRGEVVHVPDPADLPDVAAVEREDLARRGVRSFLGIPLLSGTRPVGVLGFETVREHRVWSVETITLLRLVGDIFVSALRRKKAEEQLQQSHQQLLQAQKMEAVGTLAGGIAHDFNNQLTVMLGNARHVLRHVEDEDLRDALTDLERAAEHCSQLTRSLLAFSRRSAVSPRVLDVDRVVTEVKELLRPLIPSAIRFEVQPTGREYHVAADPTQLQQVIVNLAVNARDAMPGGGALTIRTCNRRINDETAERFGLPRAGAYVEIAVIDTGKGMDDETLGRIFEPFFTTKLLGEGTGLGLATAYGIVQESGGAILVESRVNEGTTFRVLLPRSEEPSETPGEGRDAEADPTSGTVLLVEDEAPVRRVVRRTLEQMGYQVVEASDGEDALRAVRAGNLDLDALVTDLDMPHMGGIELAARLVTARPDLAVVFVSASSRNLEHAGRRRVPEARFLQKPFSDASLREVLRELRVGQS